MFNEDFRAKLFRKFGDLKAPGSRRTLRGGIKTVPRLSKHFIYYSLSKFLRLAIHLSRSPGEIYKVFWIRRSSRVEASRE